MNTLPRNEIQKHFHYLMTDPNAWKVVKYEIEISFETGVLELIILTFKSESGGIKKLKFINPRVAEYSQLQIPGGCNLYIADIRSLGWNIKFEVGDWEEETSSLFWADSVEEIF